MQYRMDKKTGNQLSVLGFGCMRFPKKRGTIDLVKSSELVHKAVARGINYFDTAYIYPGSENALGRILADGLRDKIYIADKLPIVICRSPEDFERYLERQLERLRTAHIDYYLIHMLQDMGTWKKLCGFGIEDFIAKQKKNGRIGQIGFSFHGSKDSFVQLIDGYDWDFCQIQYNYVDENHQAGKSGLQRAAGKGIPVMVMEPLLGGKLADALPTNAKQIFEQENSGYSPAAWGLRWVWNHPEVTLLLSGMNHMNQLEENVKIANMTEPDSLTDADHKIYQAVLKEFNASFKVRCTGCGYCMPCPHGVDIPTCFTAYNARYSINKSTGFHQYMTTTGGLSAKQHYASLCTDCGRCEMQCPQNIEIRKHLKEVAKVMEPFWFRPGLALARKFSGVGKE